MTLAKPTEQDERKLHAEVNQIVNQRFLLTTLAVTVFGVITAWLIPREAPSTPEPLGAFRFAAAVLLETMLFLLFLLGHMLSGMLRTIASYMEVTKASEWEQAWRTFRQRRYLGYTKPQAIVFLALGVLGAGTPFAIWASVPQYNLEPRAGVLLLIGVGLLYLLFVSGMSFFRWFDPEDSARHRWEELNR